MVKMTDHELLAILSTAEQSADIYNSENSKDNARLLKDYLQEPYGDEVQDQSSVISPDVQDVVESDMPSLARVFLGTRQPVVFQAKTNSEAEEKEVEQKNKYVNHLIMDQNWSFEVLFKWMKDAEIQKNGVVKYFAEDKTETEEFNYENVDESELISIAETLKDKSVQKVEVAEQEQNEDGTYNLKFKVTRKNFEVKIINVPNEQFLITRNATDLDSAELVGDKVTKTRGELLADGIKKSLVEQLPTLTTDTTSEQANIRNRNDTSGDTQTGWANEKVELSDLYMMIDYDGDGVAERRHILKSGNHILVNESFNHVPYASLSCLLMPHQAIGRSRAELAQASQRIKTVVLRQTLDNMYMVNHPRNVVHGDVNVDDVLNVRANGIVRMKKSSQVLPQNAIYPLVTPYVGDKSLQIMQYLDHIRSETTGINSASQGLDTDAINNETAARFNGTREDSKAKIELVARTFSETGYKKLYEGIAWIVTQYQDTETEISVLGEQLTVNPAGWKYGNNVISKVGMGAADNDRLVNSMQGILGIQQQLAVTGSPMVDQVKLFNTLGEITKGLGFKQTDKFFNDPEQPQELLQAENEILKKAVEQLQQQVSDNPLAEAEQVRAEATMIQAQGKAQIEIAKLTEQVRQFDVKTSQAAIESDKALAIKLTELEQKFNTQLDGEMQSNMLVFDASIGDFVASN